MKPVVSAMTAKTITGMQLIIKSFVLYFISAHLNRIFVKDDNTGID